MKLQKESDTTYKLQKITANFESAKSGEIKNKALKLTKEVNAYIEILESTNEVNIFLMHTPKFYKS